MVCCAARFGWQFGKGAVGCGFPTVNLRLTMIVATSLVAAGLGASPQAVDPARRAERIEEQRVEPAVREAPEAKEPRRWLGTRKRKAEAAPAAERGRSRLQPAAGQRRPDVLVPERAAGADPRRPRGEPARMAGPERKPVAEPWAGAGRTARLVKAAPVVTLDPDPERRAAIAEQPSMQDINRYQFRRSHSAEPGIPVKPAGDKPRSNRRPR